MIVRLRIAESSDQPVQSRAAQLLRSLNATEESALSRRRVWLSLVDEPRRLTRARLIARPALAAVLVVCLSAAAAGASVGRGFLTRLATALVSASEPVPSSAAPRIATPSRERAERGTLAAVPEVAPQRSQLAPERSLPATTEPGRAVSRRARAPAAGGRSESLKRSSVGVDAFASAPREEASLVLGAMSALRRDRDPARSAQMLAEYLRKYPDGSLREEALALRIEAVSSLRNPKLGAHLARGYLQSHPNGRFRELAKDALVQSTGPKP